MLVNKQLGMLSCVTLALLFLYTFDVSGTKVEGKMHQDVESIRLASSGNIKEPEIGFLFAWKRILEPCKNKTSWQSKGDLKMYMRTNASITRIIDENIKIDGSVSSIVIQTYDMDGGKKFIGGDSWRAILTGTRVQMAIVQDNMDGTYEVLFRIYEDGQYHLEMLIEHSMCDGIKDPPLGWFEKGDMHGHSQHSDAIGPNKDYLLDKVKFKSFEVKGVKAIRKNTHCQRVYVNKKGRNERGRTFYESSTKSCQLVWGSFGSWKKLNGRYRWLPAKGFKNRKLRRSSHKLNTLWIYGDSISQRWWNTPFRREICRRLFKHCEHTYTFTYAQREYNVSHINFGRPFNKTRFLEPIKTTLNDRRMRNRRSVLVINFGIHLILSLNFTELRETVDKFAELIEQLKHDNANELPKTVWRTTTFTIPEAKKLRNTSSARFLTNQRIQLFNAYANSRFCSNGIDIFDVYTVTSSYPKGCRDGVHFRGDVFDQANKAFEAYLENCTR